MSYQSGIIFETKFHDFLLSKGLICETPELLKTKSKVNIKETNNQSLENIKKYFDKVFCILQAKHGDAKSFQIHKDSDGEANETNTSSDVSIKFVSGYVGGISLKHNSVEMKAQRVRSLPKHLGLNDVLTKKYHTELEDLYTISLERYSYAKIFSQLHERDKFTFFRQVNALYAKYITYAQQTKDHSRYIQFLMGGNTQYIIQYCSAKNKNAEHLLLYYRNGITEDITIKEVLLYDNIHITLSNGWVLVLRLHNDDRGFYPNMKIKYSTKLMDMKVCYEVLRIDVDGIKPWANILTDKEYDAIKKVETFNLKADEKRKHI